MEVKENIEQIVDLARGGDSDAFGRLYSIYYKDLYRMALYLLGNPDEAENAVSDSVMDAFVGIGKLRDSSCFKAWIFRILTIKCNRQIASNIKQRGLVSDMTIQKVTDTLISDAPHLEQVLNRTMVEQAFLALNAHERNIVTMIAYGEYDSGEVAAILNMNRNTVRSIYKRSLAKMKTVLEAGGVPNER